MKRSSKGGGKGSSTRKGAIPPPSADGFKTGEYLLKRVMPNRCELCTIGVGRSMQFIDGSWQQHEHIHQTVHFLRRGGKRHKLCGDCYKWARSKKGRKNFEWAISK